MTAKLEGLNYVPSSRNEERQSLAITNGLRSLDIRRKMAKSYDPNMKLYRNCERVGPKTQGKIVIPFFIQGLCLD